MQLPSSVKNDATRLILARALRGFADGFTSVYLAAYLTLLGFSAFQIGAIVTSTLIGSAVLTLIVGLFGYRLRARQILYGATALMALTGSGFGVVSGFWPFMIVGFLGTLNPSANDVSVFLPTEQAILAGEAQTAARTEIFARYSLAGALSGAMGALLSGLPERVSIRFDWSLLNAFRAGFGVYVIAAVIILWLYSGVRHLSTASAAAPKAPLQRSRPIVLRLAALFALDSFGGGFAIDSLLVLWLFLRFGLSVQTVGAVFFAARALSAFSQLMSPKIAARIGLVETMVFTHIPANAFLIIAAFMPTAPLAVTFLLLRMALSSMDVPARQSYVMAVVPPEERPAAASVTNVPRSLATALSPLLAGSLLQVSTFGWPLVIGGTLKIIYDVLLLIRFRHVRPDAHGA